MKTNKLLTMTLILCIFCITHLNAQQGFVATGGKYSGSGGSVSFSLGQLSCKKQYGSTGSILEGVQQPFEINRNCYDFEEISDTTIFIGDIFTWQGNNYSSTGTYSESYQTTGGCDSTYILNLYVIDTINTKTLYLKLYLEGLCFSAVPGIMKQAHNASGPQFAADTADKITVELYDASDPNIKVYENTNVFLKTDGMATLADIPGNLFNEYYIVIKHRNSIETWSQLTSMYSNGPFFYDFASSTGQAFGNNLKNMPGGFAAVFCGDINQDGFVDASDIAIIDDAITFVLYGYLVEDLNGDGVIDASDMAMIDNNSTLIVQLIKP